MQTSWELWFSFHFVFSFFIYCLCAAKKNMNMYLTPQHVPNPADRLHPYTWIARAAQPLHPSSYSPGWQCWGSTAISLWELEKPDHSLNLICPDRKNVVIYTAGNVQPLLKGKRQASSQGPFSPKQARTSDKDCLIQYISKTAHLSHQQHLVSSHWRLVQPLGKINPCLNTGAITVSQGVLYNSQWIFLLSNNKWSLC